MQLLNFGEYCRTLELGEYQKAFTAFQSNLHAIKADSKNPHLKNKYMSFDTLCDTVRPLLTAQGLTFSQHLAGEYLITVITHTSGQFTASKMPFNPMDANRGTNSLQAIGGGITYAKRYALSAVLGVSVDKDDDANGYKPAKAFKDTRKQYPSKYLQRGLKAIQDKGDGWEDTLTKAKAHAQKHGFTLTKAQEKTILEALQNNL